MGQWRRWEIVERPVTVEGPEHLSERKAGRWPGSCTLAQ